MAQIADQKPAAVRRSQVTQPGSPHGRRAARPDAVILTPEGHRHLAARAAWLESEHVPELAQRLDDSDNWSASGAYGRALTELAHLNSVLGQAITTDALPEDPGIVELGDEVVVQLDGHTEQFLIVDPVEATLDQLRISIESPLSQALLGRRVGEQVVVDAPAGRYQCHIVTARRHHEVA